MSDIVQFEGFGKECLAFYSGLAKHNEKKWFEAHREQYEQHVLMPARAFVYEMGERLRLVAPGIHADPRVNKSLFRIYRDVRFSKSKSPYKTHLGIWFWDGEHPRMECPGFYFHLEPDRLFLGVGFYQFTKDQMQTYRRAVDDDRLGGRLVKTIAKVTSRRGFGVGGEHYKRVPRGFDTDHPRADLLRHNSLYGAFETKPPKVLHSYKALDYCFEKFNHMAPLHRWIMEVLG